MHGIPNVDEYIGVVIWTVFKHVCAQSSHNTFMWVLIGHQSFIKRLLQDSTRNDVCKVVFNHIFVEIIFLGTRLFVIKLSEYIL